MLHLLEQVELLSNAFWIEEQANSSPSLSEFDRPDNAKA